ncbi:TPA: hypothetical protein DEO28_01240 [Candidatus Dependentiae bacterium]|nr:MAG: hypothetical protein UR14_C0003G0098 [candidate division TM6 bacterium GW2011_GWE2_31_21]KKP53738.1 MAG: hypothetical protein UR43_C0003G0059 [candidate division TM6 bacterium GW2011_GWF2_33_332]HBS48508.1 hypothetical protein [Candidatus Dependentiae bacterium]HBZ73123.1 hypothetical protein [Candidatus Dependentiae bacterium]
MTKIFKLFVVLPLFYFSFIFSQDATDLQQTAASKESSKSELSYIPGTDAFSDLIKENLGQKIAPKNSIILKNGKAKDNKELYDFWELKFYNQEKEILQRLFKSWSVTKEELMKAIEYWHSFQKPYDKDINKRNKNIKKIELKDYPTEGAFIKDAAIAMGFKVEDINFYLQNELKDTFAGFHIEDLKEMVICKQKKGSSYKIFKYIIFHEFSHILYKDFETNSFLCSLALVKGKPIVFNQDEIVIELRKNQEMRAYILAAIKYSFLCAHLYFNRIEPQDNNHPKDKDVKAELASVESMSPDIGLIKKGLLAIATAIDLNI